MPAFLTWQLARRLLPYIAGALAILALVAFVWHKGAASRDGEVTRITASRDAALSNNAVLKRAIDQQNAALADLTRARDTAAKAALAASQAGRKREKQLAGVSARLEALARAKGPCDAPVPPEVADAWKAIN